MFFGVKPDLVLKAGTIAAAAMGDPNASIPTPQPVHYRPMFGAFGRALAPSSVTFVSQAALDAGIGDALGLAKPLVAVAGTRTLTKRDMIHNDATPVIEVDPETYEVRADGELLTCEPADGAADGAALLPVLTPMRRAITGAAGGQLARRPSRWRRRRSPSTDRHRRRVRMLDDAGERLPARPRPRRRVLADGDGLALERRRHHPRAGRRRSR